MKRALPRQPPPSLVGYELEPGRVIFVHPLSMPQVEGLTSAEHAVLALILDGHDTAAIAQTRGTSPHTTANQVASIFRKLGVGSRAELTAKILGSSST